MAKLTITVNLDQHAWENSDNETRADWLAEIQAAVNQHAYVSGMDVTDN